MTYRTNTTKPEVILAKPRCPKCHGLYVKNAFRHDEGCPDFVKTIGSSPSRKLTLSQIDKTYE